jgi:hypothetical protein
MLMTSQYQPRLSSITKIFSRRISQSDYSIQIKLNYSLLNQQSLSIENLTLQTWYPLILHFALLVFNIGAPAEMYTKGTQYYIFINFFGQLKD